jgi:hypothetical protein
MIVYLTHASAVNTTHTVTTAGVDTTGADLIVIGIAYNVGATPIISDNKGNIWTALTSNITSTAVARLYYCVNPAVGTGHTFSNTGSANLCAIFMEAFSGVAPGSKKDQETGNTSTISLTVQTGNITPTQNNELLVTVLGFNLAGLSASINSGFTKTDEQNFLTGTYYGGAMAYLIQTTAGAINPTWTRTTNADSNATSIASFRYRSDKLKINTLRPSIFTPGIGK